MNLWIKDILALIALGLFAVVVLLLGVGFGAQKMKTIDITPTWEEIMPVIIMAIENGTSEGKESAKEELMELARKVDQANQS